MKKIITLSLIVLFASINSNAAVSAETKPADVPAGDYVLDKSHASLVFKVSHLGFSQYTAQFRTFDAKLKFDPAKPEASSVEANIDPFSLALPTPPAGFTEELLGDKWLNTKKFPKITFKSTKVEVLQGNRGRITGDLTLNGITKPVDLETQFNGGWRGLPDMDPHARIGFSAHGVLKRSEFGIAYGIPEKGSNMGVSDEVEFDIEAEFSGPAMDNVKKK